MNDLNNEFVKGFYLELVKNKEQCKSKILELEIEIGKLKEKIAQYDNQLIKHSERTVFKPDYYIEENSELWEIRTDIENLKTSTHDSSKRTEELTILLLEEENYQKQKESYFEDENKRKKLNMRNIFSKKTYKDSAKK
ncbi:TPA: hypothetical protein U2D46_001507 [Streptococcus suis]|uniref:hypothetical protein n=1 Tax=Streptococcus suis TaxID=1307 RepID=UPI00040B8BC7|nr:hypothetical protein [Streptococcus suis]AZR97226.1 hypothetical protein A7J10_04980 [Streptococcus suis]KPA61960.1 hypothetical protein XK27_12700 [Streptococcus suis]MCK3889422.1 hypothetical protein [Streptococcus suis]MEE3747387.1 hypothetical protein [Streptococcus suis]NQM00792.1 hypothetical protein [Streptococcus suis]